MAERLKKGQLRKWNNDAKIIFILLTRKTIEIDKRKKNFWKIFEEGMIIENVEEIHIYHGSTPI